MRGRRVPTRSHGLGALDQRRAEGAETRGQRLVRRLRNTATGREVAGMTTDEIMALLRGECQGP